MKKQNKFNDFHTRVLDEDDVLEIRASGRGTAALARRFGISQTMVGRVRAGIAWAHVPWEDGTAPQSMGPSPRGIGTVLDESIVREIRRLIDEDEMTFGQIARRYDVCAATISGINTGRIWNWVA